MNLHVKYKLFTLFLIISASLAAQIEQPGLPLMNDDDFYAEDVLYVLPLEDPIVIEAAKSLNESGNSKALQYAIERDIDISPEENGAWTNREGMNIWRAHIISSGAYSLGLFCSEYRLEDEVKIFIYSPDGLDIKGAFTSLNNKPYGSLYIGHIPGEELIVELQVPENIVDYGHLRLGTLSHAFLPVYSKKASGPGLGQSQDCEIDINCEEGDDWQVLKRSVVYINTSTQLCTGTLINNVTYDGTSYVITAEHCINNSYYAERSAYYFNYENSSCGLVNGQKNQSISGSILKATGYERDTACTDFSLLNLSSFPPKAYNAYYAGWDARDMQHDQTVTIHHPNGDAKKISKDFGSTITASSLVGDLDDYLLESNYMIAQWDIGTTEGGSSGSPLFNSAKRLVGNLSGGEAICGNYIGDDPETGDPIYDLSVNIKDFYSKFSYNWDHYSEWSRQLGKWLDPNQTGVLSIGGKNGLLVDDSGIKMTQQNFSIFPNPSSGLVQLVFPEYTGEKIAIHVYDISGRERDVRYTESFFPVQLNLQDLPAGFYLLRMKTSKGSMSNSLIIQ